MTSRGIDYVRASGDTPHGNTDHGFPVKIGGYASTTAPTAVAEGARVNAWFLPDGRLVVSGSTPAAAASSTQGPVNVDITASTADTQIVAAPGANNSIYVGGFFISNSSTSNVVVRLKEGSGGTTRYRFMLRLSGGGVVNNFVAQEWKLPTNTALIATCESSVSSVHVNVMFRVAAT